MKAQSKIRIWITKYFFSRGIIEADGEPFGDGHVQAVGDKWSPHAYFHGKDWHRSRAEAEKRADQLCVARLKVLEKQAAEVRKLRAELFPPSGEMGN